MIHTDIYDRLPYVKPEFAAQFEVGRRFTCLLSGVIPHSAELVNLNGEKAMRLHIPWDVTPTELQLLSAQFDDNEIFAELISAQNAPNHA